MGLSYHTLHTIAIESIVSASLSIVCLLLMGISIACFRKKDAFRQRLSACLCVSIFLYIFPALICMIFFLSNTKSPNPIPKGLCVWGGFMLQWFMLATDFWTGATALYVYLRVVHRKYLDDYQLYVALVCWGIPLIPAILPFFGIAGGYVVVSSWCWISDPNIRIYILYIPVWLNFIFMTTLYGFVLAHAIRVNRAAAAITDQSKEAFLQKKNAKMNWLIIKKFAGYAIAFIIVWTPGTINRIQNLIAPDDPIAALYLIQALTTFSGGVLYFIAYGLNRDMIIAVKQKILGEKSKNSSHDTPSEHSSTRNA